MMTPRIFKSNAVSICTAIVLLVLLPACGGDPVAEITDNEAAPTTAELPEGHPSMEQIAEQTIIPPPAEGTGTGDNALAWQVPDGWVASPPTSSMRRAQYQVPGEAGNGECVVFYFGPGQGGDPMSNALRWADQFAQPDGRPSSELLKTEQIIVNDIPILLSEVTGTYAGGMAMMGGPVENLDGYALLGAVAQGPDANWYFKFTGPQTTVEANRDAFRNMLGSLSAGG